MVAYDTDDDDHTFINRGRLFVGNAESGSDGSGGGNQRSNRRTSYEDHDEEIHSFRNMSRLMLIDSSSARSDTVGDTTRVPTGAESESKSHITTKEQQQDIYETGQWGTISRRDKICFISTLIILVCGISLAVVFALPGRTDHSNTATGTHTNPSLTSSTAGGGGIGNRTDGGDGGGSIVLNGTSIGVNRNNNSNTQNDTIYFTMIDQYNALRNAIRITAPESIASQILLQIPEDFRDFDSADTDANDIYQRAMIWFLYKDTVTIKYESELLPRFVLVVTYLHNGGATWNANDNWMTSYHICLWYGIRCKSTNLNNGNHDIIEVDVSNNGLTGPIHVAWTLLPKCASLLFHSNELSGTIPGTVFGNMISLEYLYLQNNALMGTIPSTLKIDSDGSSVLSSSLSTLFVQGNVNLTGSWPIEFCPTSTSFNPDETTATAAPTNTMIRPIYSYGMNCNDIECSCCDPAVHCFN